MGHRINFQADAVPQALGKLESVDRGFLTSTARNSCALVNHGFPSPPIQVVAWLRSVLLPWNNRIPESTKNRNPLDPDL